ncbi:InlB B-repeat-containing protein [Alkalibacter saccharofermentans]|uniref:Listeria/Bacterioides repeat-containing protein n=1 Tax=Alkalibacter saccharofermentans DSM 14828 TaxID=1120975 RepID=A0A1M4VLT2_9FIRM|nr:InlB B-repeat-containing protein [Alkalibacter saccharofermentans]SHE69793.1 Listeria/Bacterioides repeat-containing protein [Alkalibacter saccharofermentans DSM 14828]
MKRTRFTRTLSMLMVVMMMMTMMPASVGTAGKNDSGGVVVAAAETVKLDVLNNSAGDIIVNGTLYTHGSVITFNAGDNIVIKSAPKEGNVFKQWNFPWARGNDKFIYEDPYEFIITEDTAVRIKFQQGNVTTYTVTFDPGDHGQIEATNMQIQEVAEGQAADDPGIIPNEGYVFSGWDKDFSNVQMDMTVTAQYSIKQHTVTFDPGLGSFTDDRETITQMVNHGGTAVTPDDNEVIAPVGHAFNGEWSPSDLGNITSDKTFTAQFDKNQYTVSFDVDGGAPEPDDQTLDFGSLVSEPSDPAKTGYSFDGWYNGEDAWNFETDRVPAENITLTAKWSSSTDTGYKVEHYIEDLDGGFELRETENLTGTTGETANATAKAYTGFIHDGSAPGSVLSGTITADGSLVLRLYYNRNQYTIDFDASGGAPEPDDQMLKFGSLVSEPTNPVKAGYSFDGWYNGEDAWDFETDTVPAGNITLTAKWSSGTDTGYTVEHYLADLDGEGFTLHETEDLTGTTGENAQADSKAYTGFTFNSEIDGTVESGTIAADGSLVLKLYYDRDLIPVTFLPGDNGTIINLGIASQMVPYEGTAQDPGITAHQGYTFLGWTKLQSVQMIQPLSDNGFTPNDLTNITEATVFVAAYSTNSYTVSFDADGGTPEPVDQALDFGSLVSEPADPVKTGYTFDGWYNGEAPWDFETDRVAAEDITLTARYTLNEYTVTFDPGENGALENEGLATQVISHGSGASDPGVVANEGYTFTGWDGSFDNITGEMTITAQYSLNEYTVTFDPGENGALENEELATQLISHGSGASDPGVVANEGYTFTGWDGSFDNITGEMTITAQYSLNEYTVTFDPGENGALENEGLATQVISHGSGASDPGVVANDGYTFTGWDGTFDNITGNLTLTAVYEAQIVVVTITESIGGTTTVRTVTFNYGDTVTAENLGIEDIDGYIYEVDRDLPFDITENSAISVDYTLASVPAAPEPETPADPETSDTAPAPVATIAPATAAPATPAAPGVIDAEVVLDDEVIPEASEELEDIVVIDQEEIPQAAADSGMNLWWLLLLLLPFLFFLLWRNRVIPILEGVKPNGDGTYTVTWGYNNRKIKNVKFDKEDSEINVLAGNILRGEEPPVEFEKGRHENVFKTVVNKDAKVEWNIKRKKAFADVLEQLKKSN